MLHTLREAAAPVELADLAAAVAAGTGAGPAPGVFDDLGSDVCPECGQRHSAPLPGLPGLPGIADAFDTRALDLAEHAGDTVRDLVDFGAAVQGPGRTPGGTVTLTPLGVLLAESILHTITPDPDQPVGGIVESVAWLPPQVALAAAGPWLAARTPDGAVSELLAFSEAFEGPMLRFIALEIAGQQGAQALAAWREAAKRPGFGAYARQWLASQGEPVEADDRDEAWLLVDTITQSVGELPDGLEALVLAAAMQAVSGGAIAELLAGIRDCGHPRRLPLRDCWLAGPAWRAGRHPWCACCLTASQARAAMGARPRTARRDRGRSGIRPDDRGPRGPGRRRTARHAPRRLLPAATADSSAANTARQASRTPSPPTLRTVLAG